MADAKPVSLAAYRARREQVAAWERELAEREKPARAGVKPTYVAAEAGKVLLRFSDGAELELSPDHAETWAERLAQMARTARALAGEGGGDAR